MTKTYVDESNIRDGVEQRGLTEKSIKDCYGTCNCMVKQQCLLLVDVFLDTVQF